MILADNTEKIAQSLSNHHLDNERANEYTLGFVPPIGADFSIVYSACGEPESVWR